MKKTDQQSLLAYRMEVAVRVFTATVGGYLLAAASNVFFALYLPLEQSEALAMADILCLILLLTTICWVFAVNSTWKAVLGVFVPIIIIALLNKGNIL